LNDFIAVFEAKLDTGSANCIFERVHGENLGLTIESGEKTDFFNDNRNIYRLRARGQFIGFRD